jgi:hypothetical protein
MPAQDDRGQWVACPAIPMGLHHVIVSIPRALDYDRVTDVWRQNGSGMVANPSVGHDSPRVVLPPTHREAYTDAEIAQAMKRPARRCRASDRADASNERPRQEGGPD